MSDSKDLYNHKGLVTFVLAFIGNVLFFVYISFIHPGVVPNPGITPSTFEQKK